LLSIFGPINYICCAPIALVGLFGAAVDFVVVSMEASFISAVCFKCFSKTVSSVCQRRSGLRGLKPVTETSTILERDPQRRKNCFYLPVSMKVSDDATKLLVVTGNNLVGLSEFIVFLKIHPCFWVGTHRSVAQVC